MSTDNDFDNSIPGGSEDQNLGLRSSEEVQRVLDEAQRSACACKIAFFSIGRPGGLVREALAYGNVTVVTRSDGRRDITVVDTKNWREFLIHLEIDVFGLVLLAYGGGTIELGDLSMVNENGDVLRNYDYTNLDLCSSNTVTLIRDGEEDKYSSQSGVDLIEKAILLAIPEFSKILDNENKNAGTRVVFKISEFRDPHLFRR